MTLDRFTDVAGNPLRGFFVRDGADKIIALGADGAFLRISERRYWNDRPRVERVERMVGMTATFRARG